MILSLAFRNIFRQRRRTLLTALTIFGGFTLCSFSIAWMDGSYNNVIDLFTRSNLGHIQIHHGEYRDRPALYRNIPDYEELGRVLDADDDVEAWAPRVYSAGLASVGARTAGVKIVGVDPARETAATHLDRKILAGRPLSDAPGHETLLGKGLARRLGAAVGDTVVVVNDRDVSAGRFSHDILPIVRLRRLRTTD